MSLCNTCRAKGSCCKGFILSFAVSKNNWYNESIKKLKEHNLEFMVPVRPLNYVARDHVYVMFDCTRLGTNGLCMDYENRPALCKLYEPKQDALCCEYVRELKGIPIVIKENK